jgi:hypothetical protein
MNSKVVALIAIGTLAGPAAALAASETLTYTSADLTSTYTNGSFPGEVSGTDSYFAATLTLNAPLTANLNDAYVSSAVTSLVFTTVDPNAPGGDQINVLNLTALQAEGSAFYFSTNGAGAITGWNFTAGLTTPGLRSSSNVLFHSCFSESCAAGSYNGQNYGATGDWYDYMPGSATASDGCTYVPASACGAAGNAGAVGKWTVAAPELGATGAVSGLLLLLGGVLVLRAQRPRAVQPARVAGGLGLTRS